MYNMLRAYIETMADLCANIKAYICAHSETKYVHLFADLYAHTEATEFYILYVYTHTPPHTPLPPPHKVLDFIIIC